MKKIFMGLLVGMFMLGGVSVAGAEEWIPVELETPVGISFEFPRVVKVQSAKEKNGEVFQYFISGTQPNFSMVVEFSPTEFVEDYPLDRWSGEKLERYLKEVKEQGIFARSSYSYITFQGHKMILNEVKADQTYEVIGLVKGKKIHLVLTSRDSTLNSREREHFLWKVITKIKL